jgi:hypothetical protein
MEATLLSPDINSITPDRGGPKTDLMYPRILVSPSYTWTYNAVFFSFALPPLPRYYFYGRNNNTTTTPIDAHLLALNIF